ncbi:MAG: NADH-quinone oxidoreductase subunit A [Vulcanisaeta sp.]|jgi:NADH:ubiquinone oxidoreductase subunit 3 (chain A)|nr:MAG: NADH-ubiquinone oxidoreductase [Vulcanisaeta sp. JCHS_4]KUO87190.1 MAG: NADH-ubiquinone oxidoreductase [Vulcanisaeta sp. MG_3]KUO92659.1 MAG: NADH-ubiquinone oxidoreductase [Vulcanisaeta sp. CIS_19]MCG2864961.1 NADH-quinone oxidoreductase subunit A [Vulcanisaeta sp.]MCG2866797.1 NADH-quinone oxidoreductase subunit A [Vulcanisaeta sp.]
MSAFTDALAIMIVLLVIALITDAAIIYVTRRLAAKNPNVVKLQRYEAGNPPVGEARYVFPIQYVGFLLVFLGMEPVIVILLILSSAAVVGMPIVIMILVILLIALPSVYVGYKYALKMAYPKEFLRRAGR